MKRLWFKSYLEVISNSINSNLFRSFFVEEDGVERDIFNDGELSCAYYVSSILLLFGQQEKPHATVSSTIKDIVNHGWKEVDDKSKILSGDVIIWEAIEFDEEPGILHPHIGFYVGDNKAVSINYKLGFPQEHSVMSDNRKIEIVYRGQEQFAKLPQPS
ncbi:MAG: hypothetical protein H6799_02650 [Candidatus Nomurabacteria bacterium]|nr:MAG: hypothetical protein H6799_02650 [Candidatus Nomurabacteria bacterium]